jgi:hypothetical protein
VRARARARRVRIGVADAQEIVEDDFAQRLLSILISELIAEANAINRNRTFGWGRSGSIDGSASIAI